MKHRNGPITDIAIARDGKTLLFQRESSTHSTWHEVQSIDSSPIDSEPVEVAPISDWPLSRDDFAHLPMNKTSGQQAAFLVCWAVLVLYVNRKGEHYATAGDLYRDPRVHGEYGTKKPGSYSRAKSNHKLRLAGDLNLFTLDGFYRSSSSDHRPYGERWEELGIQLGLPLRWGGRYGDGNHYEWADGWEWEPLP